MSTVRAHRARHRVEESLIPVDLDDGRTVDLARV
jgi:hypothetical protein